MSEPFPGFTQQIAQAYPSHDPPRSSFTRPVTGRPNNSLEEKRVIAQEIWQMALSSCQKTSGQGVQAPDPDVVSGYLTLKIALDRIGRRSWETFTSTNVNDGGELRNLAAQFNGVLALFRNRMRGNARQPVNPRIYDPSLYRRTQLENLKQLMKQLWSVVGNAGEQQVWNGLFTVTRDDHGRPIWHWNDINPVRRTAHDDAQDRRPHEPEARTSPPVVPVVHSPMIVSTSLGGY